MSCDRTACAETQDIASLQKTRRACQTKPTEAAGCACSVPARAYHVAQPPSAGITAEGGGAPCVTTNEGGRAKQSQTWERWGLWDCGLKDARTLRRVMQSQAWAGMRNKANAAGDKQTVNIVKERS